MTPAQINREDRIRGLVRAGELEMRDEHERLEQNRLRHRAAKLDRALVALRARARAYDEAPRALQLALADFQEQLASARARFAADERVLGAHRSRDDSGHPAPTTRRTTGRPDGARR